MIFLIHLEQKGVIPLIKCKICAGMKQESSSNFEKEEYFNQCWIDFFLNFPIPLRSRREKLT